MSLTEALCDVARLQSEPLIHLICDVSILVVCIASLWSHCKFAAFTVIKSYCWSRTHRTSCLLV